MLWSDLLFAGLAAPYVRMMEGEPATPLVGLETKFSAAEPVRDPPIQVDTCTILDKLLIAVRRLFQSQTQAGAASTKAAHENPETDRLRLPFKAPDDLLLSVRRNHDHTLHLRTPSMAIPRTVLCYAPRHAESRARYVLFWGQEKLLICGILPV